jgi:hypothetical protein
MSWRGAKVTGHSKAAIHQIAYRQKRYGALGMDEHTLTSFCTRRYLRMKRALTAGLALLCLVAFMATNVYAKREKFGVDARHKIAKRVKFKPSTEKNPLEDGHALVQRASFL